MIEAVSGKEFLGQRIQADFACKLKKKTCLCLCLLNIILVVRGAKKTNK
jgi:hypothetical protein